LTPNTPPHAKRNQTKPQTQTPGESKFANGNRYEGEWANGVISGTGTLHIANGDKYTGEWKDGKMHGAYGTLLSSTLLLL
jgi:hypothetical protein